MADNRADEHTQVRVYTKRNLTLKQNVPGALMWAVALERSMLTYFEMEPDTAFPEHSHEAEQITLVIEGELTFVCEGKRFALGPGDVVAIPSNKIHAVISGKAPCKAVDAWSPVRKEYLS
jgi:quercetin dioxygenase-like cupin family protein